MKKINIGKIIKEACNNKQLTEARIEKFFTMPYSEIEKMYQQDHLSSELLLKWSKLIKYDFFRIYSSHLINYHGISAKIKSENVIIEGGLQIRKNLYTPEIKEFIIQKVQSGKISTTEAIERYGVGKTTLFRWLAREKASNVIEDNV